MKMASMPCWVFNRALGAQFEDAEARGVVDEDFALGELARGGGQCGKIALGQEAVADLLEIHPGAGAEQALDELGGAHFQGKDGHRLFQFEGHVLGNVHRERRFAHRRPRGDDEHLRPVQSVAHLIEGGEARGKSGESAAIGVELLDGVDGRHHLVLHAGHAVLVALLRDLHHPRLHLVEQHGHLVLLVVASAPHTRCTRG